jgi:CAAX protease family protein
VAPVLLVYVGIAAGTTSAIAMLCAFMGWTVESRAWAVLGTIVMWAPALGRYVAQRTVDRGFVSNITLRHWGRTGIEVILWPIAVPLAIYGTAYAVGAYAGFVHWSPGGGKWTTGSQIAANVIVNLSILAVFGTLTAMGEEIGWRGFLQPRLDAAQVRSSVVIVWLCQLAYHAPVMIGAGYADAGGLGLSLLLFAAGDLPTAYIWARESYRARSLWPAVFFHSFHNTISQWVFPKLFAVSDQPWLRGEAGILPTAGYIVVGLAVFVWARRTGPTWRELTAAKPVGHRFSGAEIAQ